jgi:hypothetical protein
MFILTPTPVQSVGSLHLVKQHQKDLPSETTRYCRENDAPVRPPTPDDFCGQHTPSLQRALPVPKRGVVLWMKQALSRYNTSLTVTSMGSRSHVGISGWLSKPDLANVTTEHVLNGYDSRVEKYRQCEYPDLRGMYGQ